MRSLTAPELRRLAQAAARLAVRTAPVDDPRLRRGLDALESDTVEPAVTEQLQGLVAELDDEAAALQLQLDAFGNAPEDDPGLDARYTRTFTQARAVDAVIAALDPDVEEAVHDALYEANAALDHSPAAIRAVVHAVADGVEDPVEHAAQLTR